MDEEGELLIPFDPELVYDETSACFLTAYAGSYREVRGQLQATRVGRDQKVVQNPKVEAKEGKAVEKGGSLLSISFSRARRQSVSSQIAKHLLKTR